MADVSIYTGVGRLTRNMETKTLQSGQIITTFGIAVNPSFKKEDPALFLDCQIWGERGTKLAAFIQKGMQVAFSGTLKSHEYTSRSGENKTSLQLDVGQIEAIGGKKDNIPSNSEAPASAAPAASQIGNAFGVQGTAGATPPPRPAEDTFDDDIPF